MLTDRRALCTLDPNVTRVQPTRAAKTGHKWLTNRRFLMSENIHDKLQKGDVSHYTNCIFNANNTRHEKPSSDHLLGKENCDNFKNVMMSQTAERVPLRTLSYGGALAKQPHNYVTDAAFSTSPETPNANTSCVSMEMLTSSFSSANESLNHSLTQSQGVAADQDALLKEVRSRDPESCVLDEYTEDILGYMMYAETKYQPRKDYLRKQTEISATMRVKLVDWLIEVQDEYKLQNETLHLAVAYVDRFLSEMSVSRPKLQLLGTTSMFLAAKFEEIYPPDADEFAYVTADTYTRSEVLMMERLMLGHFKCTLSVPTTLQFLNIFHEQSNLSDDAKFLSFYFSELALLEEAYLQYPPSIRAAAAISLAVCTIHHAHTSDVDNANAKAIGEPLLLSKYAVCDSAPPSRVVFSSTILCCIKDKLQKVFDCAQELAKSHLAEANEANRHFVYEKYSLTKQRSVTTFDPLLANETTQSSLTWETVMSLWIT